MREAPAAVAAQLLSAAIYSTNYNQANYSAFYFAERGHCSPLPQRNKTCQFRAFVTQYQYVAGGFNMVYLKAFLVGGILCLIGQVLIDKTKLTPARILVCYVVIGVLLSAMGVYQKAVDFAGAGASVPLTGFGHAIAKGVRDTITEDGWRGIFTGGLKATAGGITIAILSGVVVSLIFKAKDKS